MRTLLALSCLAACGRLGFGDMTADGDARASGDGARDGSTVTTGPSGPRWLKVFGIESNATLLAGADGSVSAVQEFQTSFSADDGISLTGNGFISTAVVRYRADGTVQDTRVLDATGFCAMRGVSVIGGDTITVGYTQGSLNAAYGVCSMAAGRQDPVVIRIDSAGVETVAAHWVASAANAQAWAITPFTDGTLAISGVYGSDLTIGAALPTAMVDPNAWLARTQTGSTTTATWAKGLSANLEVHAGPVAVSGTTTYAFGSFSASTTLLGTSLTNKGGYDNWLARIDGDGTVAWVQAIGSSANEPAYGGSSSLVTLDDGTLIIALYTTGNITYGASTFPASNGPGLLLHLDSSGALINGLRLPDLPHLVVIGSRVFAELDISAPLMIGGMLYTPQGTDSVIVELGPSGPTQLIAALTGAGDQVIDTLVPIGPDALALGGTSIGALTFGSIASNSGGNRVRLIATVGL